MQRITIATLTFVFAIGLFALATYKRERCDSDSLHDFSPMVEVLVNCSSSHFLLLNISCCKFCVVDAVITGFAFIHATKRGFD